MHFITKMTNFFKRAVEAKHFDCFKNANQQSFFHLKNFNKPTA